MLGVIAALTLSPLTVLTTLTATSAEAAATPVTLNLLAINDFHGRVNSNFVKWGATIESLRAETTDPSLMVGAGDLIGASEFASAIQQDQPTIDVLNLLNLDASAVGNLDDQAGGLTAGVVGVDGGDGAQAVGLFLDRRHELGVLVTDVDVDELAGEVEVAGAVVGPEVAALGARDHGGVQGSLGAPRVEHVGAVVRIGIGGASIGDSLWWRRG